MNSNTAGLAADFDLSRLPSPPQIVSRLLQALEQERPAPSVIVHLVSGDPALSLRLLSAVGSAGQSGAAGNPLEAAVAAAGTDLLRAIAVGAAAPRLAERGECFDLDAYWGHAVLCAELGRALAREADYGAPDEAYLAGLLHNIGQVALLTSLDGAYAKLIERDGDETGLSQAEQMELGSTHADLAGELIDRWRPSCFIGDAVRYHHQPVAACAGSHPLVRILRTAIALAAADSPERFAAGAALLGLSDAVLERVWGEALQKTESRGAEWGMRFRAQDWAAGGLPAAGVPRLLGGPAPEGAADRADAENLQLLATLNDSALKHALAQIFANCRSDTEVLRAALQTGAGLSGLMVPMFFLPEAGQKSLRGRSVWMGAGAAEDLAIPLEPAVSVVAMAFLEGRVVASRSRGGALTVLDRQVLRLARSPGVLCVPLFAGSKAAGVMVASVGNGGDARLAAGGAIVTLARLTGEALDRRRRGGGDEGAQRELAERYQAHARRIIHEAGNPLGIIKNYLKVLALRLGAENSVQQELSILNEEIDRVTQIIRRFGEPPTSFPRGDGLADVNDILKELMTAYGETLFGTRRIGVELALDPEVPPIKTEEDSLKQALLNLFKNAAEAMSAGGKFVVATSDNINHDGKTYVEIRIKDNGPGIPPELMQRLYQPVASAKGEGHEGLGLSIVLSVIQRLGGAIMCRSQIGQGTVFQLLLPRNTE